MKIDDESEIVESSFLKSNIDEETFQSICKKCQLKWQSTKCQSGNPIRRICIDKECKNTIFDCNLQNCRKCSQNHKICTSVQLGAFLELLKQMTQYQKSFFKKLYQIDEQLIEKIKSSQQGLSKMISSGSLDAEYVKILEIITSQKKVDKFYGIEAEKLYAKLRIKSKEKNQKEVQLEKLFSKRSNQMIDVNIKLKTLVFENFLKGSLPNVPERIKPQYFINSPLLNICINELYINTPAFYLNKMYNNYGYLQYPDKQKTAFEKAKMNFLIASLGNPKSSDLLFRASEHNFQAAQFHAKCDGKANTLTIIRTEFRKTIFAFAAQAWNSSGQYVNDTSNKSCIIWLDPQQKLTMTNTSYSINCNPSYGPTFGNGHDILINNGGTGSATFPNGYNNNRGGASQINYTLMCGNPSSNTFKTLQYEVYQLNF